MYLIRLDDASEYMKIENWNRIEEILDKYNIKPIYGIIPNNQDPELLKYKRIDNFWIRMTEWQNKGWIPALHGYNHVFETNKGGINPINYYSEFAGVNYEKQCQKIMDGLEILNNNNINPKIFFAPAHTFDLNTLKALKNETSIRIINDTIANDIYYKDNFYYIPQQSGKCRKLPFRVTTFCYHPNNMNETDFIHLQKFLEENSGKFVEYKETLLKKRNKGIIDYIIEKIYFMRRNNS